MARPEAWKGAAGIIGRESELKVLAEFVAAVAGSEALVLRGGPGAGKTTLWEVCRDAAQARGVRVLSARPNSAEADLSFAGLADLLDGIGPEALSDLPTPQRRALEVALLRADPTGQAAAPCAIAFSAAVQQVTDGNATGFPAGSPFGPSGFVVNCPVVSLDVNPSG